ncbi:MAG: hypothetical protein NW224_00120 [Leptolyngbyaceae cyanobacterium bins.302]|nr:hypothetical protein [Leptolyngbyaceae cyanobacterium bins.302]
MNSQPSSPVADTRLSSEILQSNPEVTPINSPDSSEEEPPSVTSHPSRVLDLVTELSPQNKMLLLRQLMTQLKPAQVRTIVEFGQQILAEPSISKAPALTQRETCLILKKDYSYQERGLSEPTQYYVYLRRRKPKLDRYIGTLFYVPQGCTLAYTSDAAGRILFQPPHNVFQLVDSQKTLKPQLIRLAGLEPPPANYTFTKQQSDAPQIHLLVEYLNSSTMEPIAQYSLPFPSCMHERGDLDRYRWDVSVVPPSVQLPTAYEMPDSGLQVVETALRLQPEVSLDAIEEPEPVLPKPLQVLNLPTNPKSSTFYLVNPPEVNQVLERMRLWVAWSEKAIPQSKWAIVQDDKGYTLMNANFKRSILSLSIDQASVSLNSSLPVIIKWFHDLSLAVSQSQNQRRYSFAQLKLAHNLFMEMSLSQTDPLVLLKKLFGLEFSKIS